MSSRVTRTSTGSDSSGGGTRPDSFKGCDIIKKGYLHIKRPPSNSKIRLKVHAWQRKFFVLRDGSFDDGLTRLDMYTSEQAWEENKKKDKQEVPLYCVTHVEEYTSSEKYPHALTVTRKGHTPLVLGAHTSVEVNDWFIIFKVLAEKYKHDEASETRRPSCPSSINCEITKLSYCARKSSPTPEVVLGTGQVVQHRPPIGPSTPVLARSTPEEVLEQMASSPFVDLSVKGYKVVIEPSPDALEHNLKGEYTMRVIGGDVSVQRGTDVTCWPVLHIKKFKSERLKMPGQYLVTLEAGVLSGQTAGTFHFKTTFGKQIVKEVRDAAKKISMNHTREKQAEEIEKLKLKSSTINAKHRTLSEPCLNVKVVQTGQPRETSDPASYCNSRSTKVDTHFESHSYIKLVGSTSQTGSVENVSAEKHESVTVSSSAHSLEVLAAPAQADRPRKDSGFSELLEDAKAAGARGGTRPLVAASDNTAVEPLPPCPGSPVTSPTDAAAPSGGESKLPDLPPRSGSVSCEAAPSVAGAPSGDANGAPPPTASEDPAPAPPPRPRSGSSSPVTSQAGKAATPGAPAPVPAPLPRPKHTLTQNSVVKSSDEEDEEEKEVGRITPLRESSIPRDNDVTPPRLPPRRSSQTSTPRASPPTRRTSEQATITEETRGFGDGAPPPPPPRRASP